MMNARNDLAYQNNKASILRRNKHGLVYVVNKEIINFGAMSDYEDFRDESKAVVAIKQKGYTQYKHCSHCWDGAIVQV